MQNEQTISDIELRIKAVECASRNNHVPAEAILPAAHAIFHYLKYGLTKEIKERFDIVIYENDKELNAIIEKESESRI